jgi:acetolactate synthase-1/2/3 large subunit
VTGPEGHGGEFAVAAARRHGVETVFTLSGAHVFPVYDAATKADPPMRLLDVRHEATAVFAAEATGKLTRTPGLAVLTAGPGVTNGISAVTQAFFAGSPLVVLGGRAPTTRWGTGSLQELDHPPLLAPVTKSAETIDGVGDVGPALDRALTSAGQAHRGPVFLDVAMDHLYSRASFPAPVASASIPPQVEGPDSPDEIAAIMGRAARPVLVLGTDVWADGAEVAALAFVEQTGIPVVTNGMGRGIVPRGHRQLVTKARSTAFGAADLVVVVGTPLDFRLGYGVFGGRDGATPAQVVHIADSLDQISGHATLAARCAGDLSLVFDSLAASLAAAGSDHPTWRDWLTLLRSRVDQAAARDIQEMAADSDPIHPARIYGELLPRLGDDTVLIGDGGDFVSFAGRYVEPARPGCWLDPGPFGCLGAGLGAAIGARLARPSSPVVLLLGDGAAGMSLMDVDTIVRHDLPVVIVVGNNAGWGLERGPMRMLYGYDVVADLRPGTRYDQVVTALGGAGETVERPQQIGPALDRAFAAGVPYLVNVLTDPESAYPRSTFGV